MYRDGLTLRIINDLNLNSQIQRNVHPGHYTDGRASPDGASYKIPEVNARSSINTFFLSPQRVDRFTSRIKSSQFRRADEEQRSTLPIVRPIERCLVIELHYGAIGKGVPTYEQETFEFRASLPMTLRKTLLRCRDSTRLRVPRGPLSFSARPFARPILPCPERDNCGRLSSIRDSSGGIGLSFSGGTIITGVGVTYRTCHLRRRGPLL